MINAKTWNPAQIDQSIRRLEGIIRSGSYNPAELNQLLNQLGEPGYINTWNPAELDHKLRTLLYDLLNYKTITGNPISLRTNNGGLVKSCTVSFSPKQSGTGDPSPENVRPISGRDSLNLTRNGVNQWDEQWEHKKGYSTGQMLNSDSNIASKNYIEVFPNTSYYFVLPSTFDGFLYQYDKNNDFLKAGRLRASGVYTTENSTKYIKFASNNDAFSSGYGNNISINYPSTDTAYHAYNGETHTATFSDTVYDGSYDFVSGVLTVDKIIADIADIISVYDTGSQRFASTVISNIVKPPNNSTVGNIISTVYRPERVNQQTSYGDYSVGISSDGRIWVYDKDYTDKTTYIEARRGQKICYKLETPTEITLTAEQIELLKGQNVLWTDGDSIEITYKKLLLPSDVETLSKNKKIKEKPKTTRSKKKKEE